jgi:hypothetical protein
LSIVCNGKLLSHPAIPDSSGLRKTKLANGNYNIRIVYPPSGMELPILDGITQINSTTTERTSDGAELRSVEVFERDVEMIESRMQSPEEQGMFPDC